MTIQEMLEQLKQAKSKLEQADISDEARFDLEDLIIQTKRAIIRHSVDPLRDISQMTVIDVSQLRALTQQLGQDIQNEQRRTALIGKIIGIAKGGLRAAGLPLPI
ncbi:MAG TPA: hypothetical protein VN282_14800 [Pyrinomonadaceae bacterium]|nr:hypothetical protein [Pyrinomonadaceae bacterium]